MNDSLERRQGKSPAYFISRYGVLKEANWDENDPPKDHRPLYWRKTPLTKEQLKTLFGQADNNPLKFARLIEQAHGIT